MSRTKGLTAAAFGFSVTEAASREARFQRSPNSPTTSGGFVDNTLQGVYLTVVFETTLSEYSQWEVLSPILRKSVERQDDTKNLIIPYLTVMSQDARERLNR
jgi:hypothetical protein